jgi:hypothetical protein
MNAERLLQPYAHFVCSWTGAQMLSRAGLKDVTRACDHRLQSNPDSETDTSSLHACAHLLSWSPVNHYPLLALLASRLPISSVVVEIGTMHGAAAFALRAGLDEGCRQKGFSAIDCPSVVITYNVVDDSARNAKDCGVSKDVWMQARCLNVIFCHVFVVALCVDHSFLTFACTGRARRGVCPGRPAAHRWGGRR